MKPYLYRVAQVFFEKYGAGIGDFTFVFPNRRAGLFFQKYLSVIVAKPLFAPDWFTINQCFDMLSDLRSTDRLNQLFLLYDVYKLETGTDESFDKFVFWGEMLLNDFNEVDKNMVNARQLFTNMADLKEIDGGVDYLDDEQVAAIRSFWKEFEVERVVTAEGGDVVDAKKSFLTSWQKMYPVYESFRKKLLDDNMAYEGMVLRRVSERLNEGEDFAFTANRKFVFVGFNALNPCERALFDYLRDKGQADFYWNYESAHVNDEANKSSMFVERNKKAYKSSLEVQPAMTSVTEDEGHKKSVNVVGIPSDIGQVSYVAKVLRDIVSHTGPYSEDKDTPLDLTQTAVVLPNESMLLPLLPALPPEVLINITMGYPLSATPVFSLMEHLFEMQKKVRLGKSDEGGRAMFYHKNVLSILNHQYMTVCGFEVLDKIKKKVLKSNLIYVPQAELEGHDLLKAIFVRVDDATSAVDYVHGVLTVLLSNAETESVAHVLEKEYVEHYYVTVNRMRDIILGSNMQHELSSETFFKLLHEMTQSQSIPFVGEPLNGLQIMGTLETRCLDFKNVIVLSMNDGVFPKKQGVNSFIPYVLRKAFGMATHEQQDAIFAYNFYRLIHQAEHIHFVYDVRTESGKNTEVSRFVQQLKYQYKWKLNECVVSFAQSGNNTSNAIEVRKDAYVLDRLSLYKKQGDDAKRFSPTALNTYLDCPLKFYLTYVAGLSEQDEVKETIEASMFGTIFHKAMEDIYNGLKVRKGLKDTDKPFVVEKQELTEILNNKEGLRGDINRAYTQEYLHRTDQVKPPVGNDKLIVNVIEKYVRQLLRIDIKRAPFIYHSSEVKKYMQFPIHSGATKVNLGGIIDRVDQEGDVLRIIDYKTGSGKLEFKNLEAVFQKDGKDRPKYVLQTFQYAMLYANESTYEHIQPGIIYVPQLYTELFTTQLICKDNGQTPVSRYGDYAIEFKERMTSLLEEIMNPEVPFEQCTEVKHCEYCPFSEICNR